MTGSLVDVLRGIYSILAAFCVLFFRLYSSLYFIQTYRAVIGWEIREGVNSEQNENIEVFLMLYTTEYFQVRGCMDSLFDS